MVKNMEKNGIVDMSDMFGTGVDDSMYSREEDIIPMGGSGLNGDNKDDDEGHGDNGDEGNGDDDEGLGGDGSEGGSGEEGDRMPGYTRGILRPLMPIPWKEWLRCR